MKTKTNSGLSLVEILIVITIFASLGILSTRSVFLTLRGAKKSDSLVRVRENVNNALSVMERQIRNSESVDCVNSTATNLVYTSLEGVDTSFTCVDAGNYIASGSALLRLTSPDISVTTCSFNCSQTSLDIPPLVKITIVAEDNTSTSVEKGSITTETQIVGRNY
jgi:type II secretory pathway pseudopilin PulG